MAAGWKVVGRWGLKSDAGQPAQEAFRRRGQGGGSGQAADYQLLPPVEEAGPLDSGSAEAGWADSRWYETEGLQQGGGEWGQQQRADGYWGQQQQGYNGQGGSSYDGGGSVATQYDQRGASYGGQQGYSASSSDGYGSDGSPPSELAFPAADPGYDGGDWQQQQQAPGVVAGGRSSVGYEEDW